MGACCSTPEADGQLQHQQEAGEQDATGGLSDMYEVRHLLGSGSAGDTWLCRDRATGELLAVKLMKRPIPKVMGANIIREVKIGAQLGRGHLNIVKPKDLILTRTHLGIVMEYVAGGNMADYILKTILLKFGSFDTRDGLVMEEDEARFFFTQVLNAVEYCHMNKVAHRDLKMDNTLLDDNDPPRIKLCDFGFAKWWTDKPCMCTITGTPDYMSPELLGAKASRKEQALYDGTKADIWAAGVMLCVMLIGRFPFEGIEMSNATNLEEVSEHVWRQQNSERWFDNPLIAQDCLMLSQECIDLLNRMFDLDQAKRITIPEIRQHPWFLRPLPPPYCQAMADLLAEQARIDQQVQSGAFVSKDRDAALVRMIDAAAHRYSPEQEQQMLLQQQQEAAAAAGGQAGSGGGAGGAHQGLARLSASLLRKISLTSIKPFQLDEVVVVQHDPMRVSLNTLSDRFKCAEAAAANGTTAADGQQQQQQMQPPPDVVQQHHQQQHQQQLQPAQPPAQQQEHVHIQQPQQQQLSQQLSHQQQQQQVNVSSSSKPPHTAADGLGRPPGGGQLQLSAGPATTTTAAAAGGEAGGATQLAAAAAAAATHQAVSVGEIHAI